MQETSLEIERAIREAQELLLTHYRERSDSLVTENDRIIALLQIAEELINFLDRSKRDLHDKRIQALIRTKVNAFKTLKEKGLT